MPTIRKRVTAHQVAAMFEVSLSSVTRHFQRYGPEPVEGGGAGRKCVYDLAEVLKTAPDNWRRDTGHGGPVVYTCPVCERPRSGPAVMDACPSCVWTSLYTDLGEHEQAVACKTCGKRTSCRKPYCADHVEEMPYVQWLKSVMQ